MDPSEVRQRVLDDHAALRARIDKVEGLARSARSRRGGLDELRAEGERLLDRLGRHMRWEELHLRPALLDSDAWGRERVALLEADHAEQREILSRALCQLRRRSRPASAVAEHLLGLVAMLREDMRREEELLLDPRVLRDDVVGIDVEAG